MLTTKNVSQYALVIGLILLASYFGPKVKSYFASESDEHELIRKYLLNDSPLYGYNKPKLWIHTKYEYNARQWKSFMSRSSTDLNQPYIHLAVKTIINHCGGDFNVCLIDDNSFRQLIPGWTVDIAHLAEPQRSYYREQAFAELLYIYGGMVVPNSFVCLRNLVTLFGEGIQGDRPFVCENVNRYSNVIQDRRRKAFTSDTTMMGAPKRCPVIRELADYLKKRNENPHATSVPNFLGETSNWANAKVAAGQINLVDGIAIGTKTTSGRPIQLEDLMEEQALELCPHSNYGIYIPADEMLRRTKYQWFSTIPAEDLIGTNMIITKYLVTALTNVVEIEDGAVVIQDQGQGRVQVPTAISI